MLGQISGVLPLPDKDGNGVPFTEDVYRKLMEAPIPIYDMVTKTRGKGVSLKPIQVGTVQGLIRHQTLRFQGTVEGDFALKPYVRLLYKSSNNQIDLSSLGLVFLDQPGPLKEPNYQLREVK